MWLSETRFYCLANVSGPVFVTVPNTPLASYLLFLPTKFR